jgi:hypothetical protein
VVIAPELAEKILRETPSEGAQTLAMIRHLLQHDHQPAYQQDPARVYGMNLAGWNVRWRALEGDRVEVCGVEKV